MTEGRFGPGRLALALGLVAIAFLALRPAVDSDYGWHLANGRHLADGVLLGGIDVYSWTAAGAAWIAHEWLTEAALAALHDGLGAMAVSIVIALIVAGAFGLVVVRLRRRFVSRSIVLATIAVGFAGTLVSLGVRPQMLELLYLATTLLAVDAWFDDRLPRRWLWIAAGLGALVWANTHGSFALLPVVLGLAALGALLGREPRWPEMAGATVVAAIMPLANPWGPALYGFALQSLTSGVTGRLVQEWQPPDLLAPSFWPFSLAIGLAALGVLGTLAEARRGARPTALGLANLLVASAILALALRSGRHVMLFGIAAAPLMADGGMMLGAALGRVAACLRSRLGPRPSTAPAPPLDRRGRDLVDLVVLVVVAAALAAGGLAIVGPDAQRRATEARYPTALLPALDSALGQGGGHLFNEYTWGGFLIEERPGIPVFIDGRSEVYGDDQLERYARIVAGGPDAAATLDSLGVDVVLVKADSPLVVTLLATPAWVRQAGDGVGILLARARTRP